MARREGSQSLWCCGDGGRDGTPATNPTHMAPVDFNERSAPSNPWLKNLGEDPRANAKRNDPDRRANHKRDEDAVERSPAPIRRPLDKYIAR